MDLGPLGKRLLPAQKFCDSNATSSSPTTFLSKVLHPFPVHSSKPFFYPLCPSCIQINMRKTRASNGFQRILYHYKYGDWY